jgi:hypothetical protein
MTSTSMARLQDVVRINATGALDGIIRLELFNVLKDFLQRTDAWLMELPVYIIPTTNDYQLQTGQNVIVNRLMDLNRPPPGTVVPEYAPMCPPQFLSVVQGAAQGQANAEAQNPLFRTKRAGILLNAGAKCPILRIVENPTTSETWIATVGLTTCDPTDADGFVAPPDWVVEKYLTYIASGVIMRLMLQPGKPYSSMPGSQYHGRMYNQGVGLARTEVRRMFTYGAQRWVFPQGWNGRYRYFGSYTGTA